MPRALNGSQVGTAAGNFQIIRQDVINLGLLSTHAEFVCRQRSLRLPLRYRLNGNGVVLIVLPGREISGNPLL